MQGLPALCQPIAFDPAGVVITAPLNQPIAFHPIAGSLAMISIAAFWLSNVLVELLGATSQIAAVKPAIPWGFLICYNWPDPRVWVAGVLGKKACRIPIIAANSLLILIPSALFLAAKATSGEFDSTFYVVQSIELSAGAISYDENHPPPHWVASV